MCAALVATGAADAAAAVVSYRKGDGKGIVSETDDTTIRPSTANQSAALICGVDRDGHDHCLLKFPNIFGNGANQIPLGSPIVSATLTLYVENDGANDGLSCPEVFQLTESWTEAQATWNLRSTGVNWAVPGADGTASHKPAAEGIIGCDPIGFYNLTVTTSVQNWSSGEANEGWVLIDQGPSVDGIDFTSSEGVTLANRPMLTVDYTPQPHLTQGHYRWRNDDGTEAAATWAVPEDTTLVAVPRGTTRRVRFGVANTGAAAANVQYRLQVGFSETCDAAAYVTVPVGAPGQDWDIVDSANFADAAATTNVAGGLSDGATTFVAGQMKDAGNPTGAINLASDQFTEIEFALRANASAVTGGNYCFRLYDETNNRVLDGYSAYAQARVASAGPLVVRTGSYVGNGATPRAISVGFRPDVVIVKGNLDEYAVIRTATMTASRSIFYDNFNPYSDAIRSLDTGGFTVGSDIKVNSSGITYYWTAFQAGSGEMSIGTYDGNDVDNRDITGLGFQPHYVLVMAEDARWSIHRFAAQVGDLSMTVEGGLLGPNRIQALLADGFQVGTNSDVNDGSPVTRYHWIAWNHVPGRVHVSSYTGNGGTQAITAPGFLPEYVLATRDQNSPPHQKPASIGATSNLSHPWGGYPAAMNVSNAIRTVLANGFEVGTDPDVNANATPYYYAAFAGARLEQVHTRWRNDDGSEAAATWAAAEDTAITGLSVGTIRRLRFEVSNEGAVTSAATSYELQAALAATCSTGTYTTVTTGAGGPWQIIDSTFLTDAAATTNVTGGLTDEGTTFVAGRVKDAGSSTAAITLAAGEYTEIEFSLRATANAVPGATYCFRLYDVTGGRALDGYWSYAQATLPALTLGDVPAGQIGDQFATGTPVTAVLFQFRLSRAGSVTVDTLRARFTTASGVANGDVSAGELWEDTNGNGVFDGAGPDTLLQGAVAPVAGVLTFTSNFSPSPTGTNYFVRATAANLAGGDTTTFSLGAADVDTVEPGVGEPGAITNAVHTRDYFVGGDVYYSVGTSTADMKTGTPTITISNGTATLSVAQTGYIGVGDEITYNGATRAFIKAVISPSVFVVHTPTGGQPSNVSGQTVNTIRRAFNTIALAESGSTGLAYLNTNDLAANNINLTWVCYNDGPFDVTTPTLINGYVVNASRFITLTVAGASDTVLGVSHRHGGTAGGGVVIRAQQDVGAAILTVDEPNTRVLWLEIDGRRFGGQDAIYLDTSGSDSLLSHLLIHDIGWDSDAECPTSPTTCRGIAGPAAGLVVRNSFIYDFGQDGINASGAGVYVANTTIFRTLDTSNPGESIQCDGGSLLAENVIAADASFFKQGGCVFTCNNTFSSDGSAADGAFGCTGTGNRVGVSAASQFVSTTVGAVDLHLKGTADAIGAGKDLSGTFTNDIDDEARSAPWDVGADEWLGPSGLMLVKSGSYTGNATDNRQIHVGWQPDVVLVKNVSASLNAVLRTATMTGDSAKSLQNFPSLALAANLVQSLDAQGFTVGSASDVNQAGQVHHWVAFKAAPGELRLGTYTGNGSDNRSVTGVGFEPDYLFTLPADSGVPVSGGTTFPADTSFDFDATQVGPNLIQAFEPDGFQVGSDVNVNANGVTYHYVAWNAVPGRIAVGTYAGDGLDNRNLDVVGFFPEWVVVKKYPDGTLERAAMHKPASTGVNTDTALRFADVASIPNTIQALRPLGFQVGNDTDRINSATDCGGGPCTYHYVAFGPHAAATTNYRSIGTATDYATGTVEAINGSTAVTGTGTSWLTANRGRGDVIVIPCPNPPTCTGGTPYQVRAVGTNGSLTLSTGFAGTSAAGLSYVIRRQHATILSWFQCISNQNACAYFDAPTSSLVADDRREIGIAYEDSVFVHAARVDLNGSVTDPTHDIVLTADGGNRHNGTPNAGVKVTGPAGSAAFLVRDNDVTIEWLEITGGARALDIQSPFTGTGHLVFRNNLLHNFTQDAVLFIGGNDADINNNFIYAAGADGIDLGGFSSNARIDSNTIYGNTLTGITGCTNPDAILRNNIVVGNGVGQIGCTGRDPASRNNLTSNASGTTNSPAGGGINNVTATDNPTTCATPPCVGFVSLTVGSENLHLASTTYVNQALDAGVDLSALFAIDVDGQTRAGTWDIGADEFGATTAVKLQSFVAIPGDASVLLEWRTGSELDNLGFHVYRGSSAAGPWTRLTSALIPGLGSSALGQAYSFRDVRLVNGMRYFYRLEDVDTASKATSHGPVSAVPAAGGANGSEANDVGSRARRKRGTATPPPCPDWVATAYAATTGSTDAAVSCSRHGEPEAVSVALVSRDVRQATVELRTGGFYALREPSGRVRAFVPGFDFSRDGEALALPFRRVLVDAVVGRRVQLGGVRALDPLRVSGLEPAALGKTEMQVSLDGTVKATRRDVGSRLRQALSELVRLQPSVFQGEAKSAVVEISPLRWDARSRSLTLSRRVEVKLLFSGREPGENGRANRGRRRPRPEKPGDEPAPERVTGEVLARLYTTGRGLYSATFEDLFPGRTSGLPVAELSLARQGQAVAFHVEPSSTSFGAGGRLYFHAEAGPASSDFSPETAWELRHATDGVRMALGGAAPAGSALASAPGGWATFELERYYQPGLLEAEDLWLWEAVTSGATRVVPFTLAGVDAAATDATLELHLQGASESGLAVDHHVRISLGGVVLGETQFAGKKPHHLSLAVPRGLLREGANELSLTNIGVAGASSLVFLDRFGLAYPQAFALAAGVFEGSWSEGGVATVTGAPVTSRLLDVTPESEGAAAGPRWLTGFEAAGGALRFAADAGRTYLVVAADAVGRPRVAPQQPSTLRAAANQADYLLIAPRELLPAAEPLVARRLEQGLQARAVAFEEIADEFGHGQPSAEAIRAFLAHTFHSWAQPSPRYVLLVGDASYDPRRFVANSRPAPLPALWTRTSYLWTASDPLLAAVNGDDALPDFAIGRLPAATVEEAQALVAKLLDWEDSGQGLEGRATLVADNPDAGGDFEANAFEIAESYLAGRSEVVLLRELGAATRPRIQAALDEGRSYLDYVGHGGAAVWASENVWNSWDVASLRAQSRQPLLLTLNCLNGYFVAPSYDSLSESLVKAEGRGAIAALSPSGLSLDGPAHLYHGALMAELTSGRHQRLGDAILAAQARYAGAGLMPELLAIYHLFGDPAMPIR